MGNMMDAAKRGTVHPSSQDKYEDTFFACGELKKMTSLTLGNERKAIYQVDLKSRRPPMPWITQYDLKGFISASDGFLFYGLDWKLHVLRLKGRDPKSGPFNWDDVIFTPFEIRRSSACAAQRKIFISGSMDEISEKKVSMYDQGSKRFYAMTPMTQGRARHSSLVWENLLVVVGGFYNKKMLPSVEAFDLKAGKWTVLPPLPQPLCHHAMCVWADKLIVAGGYLKNENRTDKVWSLDFNMMKDWEEWPPMITPRDSHGLIPTEEGTLAALGGNRGPPTAEVMQRDGKWTPLDLKADFIALDKATCMRF
ncbi:unnamed protein product [Darwinula stevensoni]|uniref:Kelch repeat-containing protein n=1 Tax=Darwinula stevensoni TaxID=69355 RepID=A0A7R9ADZ0_9CRUS|nr:unnamed protein product [Darwinula stevensoni]CAG0901429.1 unnamed protein product [Darwinula stevensoni]